MSEYKSIKGKTVQFLGTDPSETSTEGQVWYNSTAGAFKSILVSEAWSSGGALSTARAYLAGMGTQTAALAAGGAGFLSSTEEYNGSGWSNGGDLNTGRTSASGAGTQTAGLAFGGTTGSPGSANVTGATEEYDGSSWTASNALNTATQQFTGAGTQTAGLGFGGYVSGNLANTEEYDGTSWTAANALNTSVRGHAGVGIQTAAVSFGGFSTTFTNATEEYDGTSWTAVNNMNTARTAAGAGTQNAALAFGGSTPPFSALTEKYDGTTWTTSPATLATARQNLRGAGTQLAALAMGGEAPGNLANTEEYNKSINVITGAAFSSGGTATETSFGRNFSNMGTQNATYMNAGYNGSYKNETEEYNGTSWSGGGSSSNFRYYGTGAGTLTSGLAFGGFLPPPTGATNLTEEYNGSSWTSGGNMNSSAGSRMGGGPQTAAIACGGTGPITATEYYDGSTWTTQPATLNETHRERNGVGTQSSFVAMGGTNPAETVFHTDVEEYNGTSWSSVAELVIESKNAGGIIGQSADSAVYVGGQNSNPATNISNSQVYDGVSVVTGVNPAHSARSGNQGAGTSSAGGLVSGRYPSVDGVTEEFTGETSALNVKTLTTS